MFGLAFDIFRLQAFGDRAFPSAMTQKLEGEIDSCFESPHGRVSTHGDG